MRAYIVALRIAGIAGALAGAGVGLLRWSWAWPGLSLTAAAASCALGWLVGVAVSPALAWGLSRRPKRSRTGPAAKLGRAGSTALTVLAMAPGVLWLTMALPNGFMRDAMAAGRRPGDTRPNLILITIDALRPDYVGDYGNRDGLTPNIDSFSEEATRYEAAYVASPWTLTSFAAVLTSLAPSECGLKLAAPRMHDWYLYSAKLPESVPLLHEQLQSEGYTTAAELTNCFLTAERGWRRGFDYFRNEDGPELGTILTRAGTVTGNALAWLRLNRREPFFLWAHYLDPHVPYNAPGTPAELRARYPRQWLTRREYWYESMRRQDEGTKARYQEFCRRMYAEEVRYADRWVGKLLDGIKDAGLWEDSLIVITADHGEELFEHEGFEHGHTMHEELLRVPLLVKWPEGLDADKRITQTVALADLPATFFEVARSRPPAWLKGGPLPRRDGLPGEAVYSEGILHGVEQTALTTDEYKVIHHPATRLAEERLEVYARGGDREEKTDLAGSDVALDLRGRLVMRTRAAEEAAKKWEVSHEQEFRGIDLSRATREKLRTLGYIGD